MAPVRGLFSRRSYDADASVYTSIPTSTSPRPHGDPSIDSDSDAGEAERDGLEGDMDVLREEEEREKLLSGGDGLFGSIGRKVGNGSIKIGKNVKGMGRRRKNVGEVVEMMGGKRLGMEERGGGQGESGIGESESESELEEDGLLAEKLAFERKPRKPTPRVYFLATTLLLTFLLLLIFISLNLSSHRLRPVKHIPPTLSNGTHPFRPTTLLISLDGFRADFLSRHLTPTLSAFVASGLSPRFLTPSFPTVTFPNHWTLVTGLHPESHGIVGNTFWDPTLKEEFVNTDPARSFNKGWWGGEPIWTTAEKQGLKAAVHMWPGSEAANQWGVSYVDPFNATEVLTRKTDRILSWLDLPLDQRPQLIAAYVPDVDSVGHQFGPNTTETDATIRAVDGMMGDLLKGLGQRNLTELINIIVVSDHGMASTSNDRLIYLDDIIDMSQIEHTDGWPLYGLRPHPHVNLTALHATLVSEVAENVRKGHSHWNVYLRDDDMPARWHFSNSERIAPLWIIPDTGYAIVTRKEFDVATAAPGVAYSPAGLHGYDNLNPLMRAMFVARGPAFRHLHGGGRAWVGMDEHSEGAKEADVRAGLVEEFGNWEVYRILCEMLGIQEAAGGNNATIEGLSSLKLIEDPGAGKHNESDEHHEDEVHNEDEDTESSELITLTSTPSLPTPTVAPIKVDMPTPVPTTPPTDSTADDDSDTNKEALDWLEYVKMRAEKLKEALDKWWKGVWVDDDSK